MVFKDRLYFGEPPEKDVHPTDDAQLESDVASALANASEVDAVDVRVTAIGGQVTLAGRVAREEEIAKCGEIALMTDGVVGIHNHIEVWTPDS